MNPIDDSLAPVGDQQLDLLVDGELGETERRELLGRLDRQPDGWRRCALAFLEAQCWRQETGSLVRPVAAEPAAPRPARSSPRIQRAATLLAMAATFLVALGMGWFSRGVWRGEGPAGPQPMLVARPAQPARAPAAAQRPQDLPGDAFPAVPAPSRPWQMVTLSMPDAQQHTSRSIRLPAMERDRIDDAWLNSFPGALPRDVLQALEQTGHQVRQSRELIPLPMEDGRRLVVPVDQVEVHYVGNGAYQ